MPRGWLVAAFVLVLIAVVVCVDVLVYRNRFWERLAANIAIVLSSVAFYFLFLRK